jgi:hypothetical protein
MDREASDWVVQTAVDMMKLLGLAEVRLTGRRQWRSSGMNDRFPGVVGPMKTK